METIKLINNKNAKKTKIKFLLILAGILIYSIGLKWFVYSANILPSGFTGVSVLIQNIIKKFYNIIVPITVLNVAINLIPAYFSIKIIGKNFTIISFIILFAFSFVADAIPQITLTKDPLVASLFGGVLCGYGASLFYRCGLSGGGTDFIALSLSEKFHIQTFHYVLIFNVILISIQGLLYGWDFAFYSIIYQFINTQVINWSYRHYETRTIFIITEKPTLVSKMLIKESGHSSTQFKGKGSYTMTPKTMLYTVVTQPEVRKIIGIVKKCDDTAFINIIHSNEVEGNFKYLPVEIDEIDEVL